MYLYFHVYPLIWAQFEAFRECQAWVKETPGPQVWLPLTINVSNPLISASHKDWEIKYMNQVFLTLYISWHSLGVK